MDLRYQEACIWIGGHPTQLLNNDIYAIILVSTDNHVVPI